jgi:hypothetical protein
MKGHVEKGLNFGPEFGSAVLQLTKHCVFSSLWQRIVL